MLVEKKVQKIGEELDEQVLTDVVLGCDGNILTQDQEEVVKAIETLLQSESKVEKMYRRYQKLWLEYVRFHDVTNEWDQDHLIKFFSEISKVYSPSTLWVIYSCINSYFIGKYGKKLNGVLGLQKFLKGLTSRYVCKKSKTFSPEQMHQVISFATNSKDYEDTLMGVGISLLYYGLLRSIDVLNITIDDVHVDKTKGKTIVRFEHTRKRRNEGYTFHIPSIYQELFVRYSEELHQKSKGSSRFLKNWVARSSARTQNAGKNMIIKWIARMCSILKIDPAGYTTHCFRRSAATNLADAGVSFVNLKRHGQWLSDSVVEGYIANSVPLRKEREEYLLPENMRDALAQLDIDEIVENHRRKKQKLTNILPQDLPEELEGEDSDPPLSSLIKPKVKQTPEEIQEEYEDKMLQEAERFERKHEVEYVGTGTGNDDVQVIGTYSPSTTPILPTVSSSNSMLEPADFNEIFHQPKLEDGSRDQSDVRDWSKPHWGILKNPTFNSCTFSFN